MRYFVSGDRFGTRFGGGFDFGFLRGFGDSHRAGFAIKKVKLDALVRVPKSRCV